LEVLESATPVIARQDDEGNYTRLMRVLAGAFGDGEKFDVHGAHLLAFVAMCKRVEAGHATPDDDRIMAAAVEGWAPVADCDGREYVLAMGSVLADL
jgi:hypothetical protein